MKITTFFSSIYRNDNNKILNEISLNFPNKKLRRKLESSKEIKLLQKKKKISLREII